MPQPAGLPHRLLRDGRAGALYMGAKGGAWCLGCCWALMASLFALGLLVLAAPDAIPVLTIPGHHATQEMSA